jgi:molybdopterin synthase catalytic subunit
MRIRVLFFGVLRDLAGLTEEYLEVPEGSTLGDVFGGYARRFPPIGNMARSIMLARNQEFGEPGMRLAEGDEVALLPPVSGGSGGYLEEISEEGNFFALTRAPINTRALAARVLSGSDGAVVTFEGVVRNNTAGRRTRWLEYQAYQPMAVRLMARIGAELRSQFELGHIAMVHRLGRLLIGETSVAIIVTAPHRGPALQAAQEGIDRLKRLVPIWKKEVFEDGEVWVEGEWDSRVAAR